MFRGSYLKTWGLWDQDTKKARSLGEARNVYAYVCMCMRVCKCMCCVFVHVCACAYLRAENQGPTEVTVQIDRHSVPFSVPGCRG